MAKLGRYIKRRRTNRLKTVKDPGNEEFYSYIKDLVHHPYVLKMKNFPHHCETNCYQHCLNVAYFNYRICKFFHLDAKSAARAGMLHDLFLYDWRGHWKKTGDPVHAMTHPHAALRNAKRYFKLNKLEEEMIVKHMFPVTPIPPTHWETWIITLTDKYCGTCEIGRYYSKAWFPRGAYLFIRRIVRRVFGEDYQYKDYILPFGEEAEAGDKEVNFAKLRVRSGSGWKKGNTGKKRGAKY